VQLLGGADALPEHPHQVLLLRANELVLSATHLRNVKVERAGCGRCRDHSINLKKPFHRLLLKLVHQDCRLSERRFDFHSMRVSGESRTGSNRHLSAIDRARVSRRSTTIVLARFPDDALDHPRSFLTHRLLADRIGRANLAAAESLARVDMRKGNAAAPR